MPARSVLIVDDNVELLEVLRDALSQAGLGVRIANSGARALELLVEAPSDVILLDVKMPGMSGPVFLDVLQSVNPELVRGARIAFTSAARPPEDARVCGYIDKMTDLPELLSFVENIST